MVNPRLAFGFTYRNDLLGIEKASYPTFYYSNGVCPSLVFSDIFSHDATFTSDGNPNRSEDFNYGILTVKDPKLQYSSTKENNGIVLRSPTMFLVTDNLVITPISSSTSFLSILRQLEVPFNDIQEKVVHIGKEEVMLSILIHIFNVMQ